MTDEVKNMITEAVESAVDKKINGKLVGLKSDMSDVKAHLASQDEILKELKVLLEDKNFLAKLWQFLKSLFAGLISLGGAYLLYKDIISK